MKGSIGEWRLANRPTQAESQQHSLGQAAGEFGLHVNADITEYMCFNQKGDISTLKTCSLKFVDKFFYLGSSVASSENDIQYSTTCGVMVIVVGNGHDDTSSNPGRD